MTRLAPRAILAEAVTVRTGAPFVRRNVTTRRTGIVVVVDALVGGFLGFIYRVEVGYFRHETPLGSLGEYNAL